MQKRLQTLEAKAAQDNGMNSGRPTTPKNASGDGNKKRTMKLTPKTTTKSILRTPGTAVTTKPPNKKKSPENAKSTSDNHFAALAGNSNDTSGDKKPRAQNRQRSSSKSRKSGGTTNKSN
jgi:hypothetical protein